MSVQFRPTRAEIDTDALARNVARIAAASGTEVCAVVKADGYGHGAVLAARAALEGGASWLAVALAEEAIELREAGIDAPLLLLSEPPIEAIDAIVAHRLTPTVYRPAFIAALDAAAAAHGRRVGVHLKLDTGMVRVGVPEEEWAARCVQLASCEHLDVEGCQTHLARADEPSQPTTREQLERFGRGLATLVAHGIAPRLVHVANTAGALVHAAAWRELIARLVPDAHLVVRPGIGIYGLDPGGEVQAAVHGLEPVLRLTSAVSLVRRIAAGTPVSYGHRWSAPADGWLATVPIGYADGVPRVLTGRLEVLHGGVLRPVAGTITMDQILVWCGEDEPQVGDEVVLIGAQAASTGDGGARISVEDWAAMLGTITYEVVTSIGARVPRVARVAHGPQVDAAPADGADARS
jgi:alanine racemase